MIARCAADAKAAGPSSVKPCMGGFCQLRDKCRHHVAPMNRDNPAERLCEMGQERVMFFKPLQSESPVKETA